MSIDDNAALKSPHVDIVTVLKSLESHANENKLPKVAALISAAIASVSHVLFGEAKSSTEVDPKEDQWFDTVLDELARYCHIHGMIETELHLISALDAWHKEKEAKAVNPILVTLPLRKLS